MPANIPLCPVSGWTFQTAPNQIVFFNFEYLSHEGQELGKASKSPNYALTTAQAIELAAALQRTAAAAAARTDVFPPHN